MISNPRPFFLLFPCPDTLLCHRSLHPLAKSTATSGASWRIVRSTRSRRPSRSRADDAVRKWFRASSNEILRRRARRRVRSPAWCPGFCSTPLGTSPVPVVAVPRTESGDGSAAGFPAILWTPPPPIRKLTPIAGRPAAFGEALSPRPRRFPTGTQSHEQVRLFLRRRQGGRPRRHEGPPRRQGRQPRRDDQHRPARPGRLHPHHRSLHLLLSARPQIPARAARPGGRGPPAHREAHGRQVRRRRPTRCCCPAAPAPANPCRA